MTELEAYQAIYGDLIYTVDHYKRRISCSEALLHTQSLIRNAERYGRTLAEALLFKCIISMALSSPLKKQQKNYLKAKSGKLSSAGQRERRKNERRISKNRR